MAENISTRQAEIDHANWVGVARDIVTGKIRITFWSEAKAVTLGLRYFRKDPIVCKALDTICQSPVRESSTGNISLSVSETDVKKRLVALCQEVPYECVCRPLSLQSELE